MDRVEFAKILNSIVIPEGTPTEKINTLTHPISEAISQMMPNSLFRFRPFNPQSLDAFKDGLIYAVTADMFNDPYDTLPKYDLEEIKRGVNSFMDFEALESLKSWLEQGNDFPDFFKQYLPSEVLESLRTKLLSLEDVKTMDKSIQEAKSKVISSIEILFPGLAEVSKRFSTTASFCESILPVLMWSHYADSHMGFALEYNFRPTLAHPLKNVGIYPVIYGEERLDVSSFIVWEYLWIMGMKAPNPDLSASIKNVLYKSSVWTYEREWRLVDFTPRDITSNQASAIPYEPVAIYYGSRMSMDNRRQLHEIAVEKGIKELEMFVDYSSPKYEMKYKAAWGRQFAR